mgnify:CR=1 FL=1
MGPDTPLMVLSGNSIEHAVLMLGAMKARVPVAPISVPYSLMSPGHEKLRHVVKVAKPAMIFVDNAELYAGAIADIDMTGITLVVCEAKSGGPDKVPADAVTYETLCLTPVDRDAVIANMEQITHETVGKYLFTSGSTGMPKGVLQTHGMMCAVVVGQEALRDEEVDPDEVPETLEWMPWNHISAGNISFNNVLHNAGTLYLDAGKPIPGMFDQTIANLREVSPQVFGSAPIAFAMLADAMIELYAEKSAAGIDNYSQRALARIWKAERFSWWMTSLLHTFPETGRFGRRIQRAEFDYLSGSHAAQQVLAENYVGLPA